eukprot:CAMPEP_0113476834 /NCGR_PEP_ID=MMETSP0014_2-20120614/19882_1 /TAXON_ID=2857 /ORGANISM="Nitzschia sp." /LENGTH=197 /DNA_ID=CAMNT_0000369881 /DNA_START=119 /DNA_END=712 /DNA_ORIENTATION=- /assembly_acc=CAM_ASM_000159
MRYSYVLSAIFVASSSSMADAFVVKTPTSTAAASSLTPLLSASSSTSTSSSAVASDHLSEIDELCIENAARYCLENDLAASECDLEEYEALVSTLKQQREFHLEHTHTLNDLLTQLPDVNAGPIQQKHLPERDEKFVEEAASYLLENNDTPVESVEDIERLVVTLQEQDQFHLEHLETINDLLSRLTNGGNINGLSA